MVKCKFNYPIIWKAYDGYFDWMPPTVKNSSFFSESEKRYVSILTIGYTSAATVGRYYCVVSEMKNEDMDDMVAEDFASHVYLFVIDYKQPLVPTNERSYYMTHDKFVIPCKPSYRDIEVELCNKDEKCLTVSDSTRGFTISKTSSIISEDGMLYCKCDNASYAVHILPADDWLDNNYEPIKIAQLDERKRKPYYITTQNAIAI
ncbi:hypothetical protein AND_001317 [Anopheles darlingi]|uniref:Ig-like domain-containing protein n=1 Tax=Anopheles darlingi TaxID=43151 RepID=W5JRZ7_ANODA|nr:hypothetical protein AND_001317 [Anopheles darlingi]